MPRPRPRVAESPTNNCLRYCVKGDGCGKELRGLAFAARLMSEHRHGSPSSTGPLISVNSENLDPPSAGLILPFATFLPSPTLINPKSNRSPIHSHFHTGYRPLIGQIQSQYHLPGRRETRTIHVPGPSQNSPGKERGREEAPCDSGLMSKGASLTLDKTAWSWQIVQ